MQTKIANSYSQSVDDIAAGFLDEGFLTAKFEALGSRNIDVCVEALDDDEFEVTIRRDAPAEVPGALKSVLKPWNTIKQVERWSGPDGGPYCGDITVTTEGIPAAISSKLSLTASAGGCEQIIDLTIKCSIPIIGKTLAKFIAKESAKSIAEEHAFIAEFA